MKILFVTDDRSECLSARYYLDWQHIFQENHEVVIFDPQNHAPSKEKHKNISLVIIAHGAINCLTSVYKERFPNLKFWKKLLVNYNYLKELSNSAPFILFSKNDYKDIPGKTALSLEFNAKLVITHSRESIIDFHRQGIPNDKLTWIPFSYDSDLFVKTDTIQQDIDIGYRGNMNEIWIGDIRHRFLKAIEEQCSNLNLDLVPSEKAENFLHGKEYAAWLNRCKMFANTNSAVQTAGPRFFEAIACGATVLAPVHRYEGMLYPDEHYVAVHDDFHDVYSKINKFLSDHDYQEHIQKNSEKLIQSISVTAQYNLLMKILEQRSII